MFLNNDFLDIKVHLCIYDTVSTAPLSARRIHTGGQRLRLSPSEWYPGRTQFRGRGWLCTEHLQIRHLTEWKEDILCGLRYKRAGMNWLHRVTVRNNRSTSSFAT